MGRPIGGRPPFKGGRGSFLIGGGHRPPMDLGISRAAVDVEPDRVPRRLSPTPIYEGGHRTYVRSRPKQLRDMLYDRLCDWAYHSREELDKWLPDRQWVKAMCDLVAMDYTFDSTDRYLRLRKRRFREPEPSIVAIISRLLFPSEYGSGEVIPEPIKASVVVKDNELFGVAEDSTDDALVLDDEGAFCISLSRMVTDMSAVLARRGAGKTYLALGIAESFLFNEVHDIPFVWLDPMGNGWGLLANEDGSPIEKDIVLLGGVHGHRPLLCDRGRVVAKCVKEMRVPFVLDMSQLPEAEQHQFVADFLNELYFLNRLPLHVFMDEVDIFAPQQLKKGMEHHVRCLAAVDNFARRGRAHGLGGTLISQRAAVIHKNVLTQLRQLFLLQAGAPQDLRAVASWFTAGVNDEQIRSCLEELPILPAGTAYYTCSGEDYRFGKFKVKRKRTFDSSYTPNLVDAPKTATLYSLRDELAQQLDSILGTDASDLSCDDDEDEDER